MKPISHCAAGPLARIGLLALAAAGAGAPHRAAAQSICESCEVQAGLGSTYHFWGPTGGVVLPVTGAAQP